MNTPESIENRNPALALARVRQAEKRLLEAAAEYTKACAAAQPAHQEFVRVSVKEMRSRLNRVVRQKALAKRLTTREIWILLYERMRQTTGFNAISRSTEQGLKTHLDAVQNEGLLPLALTFAARM